MGTPRYSQLPRELRSPEIADKVRVFAAGKEARAEVEMTTAKLFLIFEEMRNITLPLVPWLARQVFAEGGEFEHDNPPPAFKKKRVLLLFRSACGLPYILLDRSGSWIIIADKKDNRGKYLELQSSMNLAKLFVKDKREALLHFSLEYRWKTSELVENEINFLEDIVLYNGALKIVAKCFETISREINERERRMRIVREWATLLHDFGHSLDPLIASGEALELPDFSIFHRSSHGESRATTSYLAESCLIPFRDNIRRSMIGGDQGYFTFTSAYNFKSLQNLLDAVAQHTEEIAKARKDGKTDAKSLSFGFDRGRLPFSNEERAVLKKLVESLKVMANS